jgi:hypothetical protein
VNREERHFGFLVASALIHAPAFRRATCALLAEACDCVLDPTTLEVFAEVAALRDYWRALGDPVAYAADTHSRRRVVLERILEARGYPPETLDAHGVFWTGGLPRRGKLWSPSEWSKKDLAAVEHAPLDLVKVRWAFNAKPDLLLVSGAHAAFIEIKLESRAGRTDDGYDQLETQRRIASLMKQLIPAFAGVEFTNTALTLERGLIKEGRSITWRQMIQLVEEHRAEGPGMDYVWRSLLPLARYAKAPGTRRA